MRFLWSGCFSELPHATPRSADIEQAQEVAHQPSPGVLRLTIHEGRNRQVRRMCDAIGHPVLRLVRTRIGPLTDRSLRPSDWRELSTGERRALTEAVAEQAQRYDRPT